MMAKMFYKLEEAKSVLGKNEEEIKQLTREGRLREFRDGPHLMYKVDQVEALKQELGLGGSAPAPDMGPSDSGGPIGLMDSRGGSATGISLVDTDMGSGIGSSGAMQLKDDTALAADLGLSGSVGGVPSPGRPGSSSGSLAGSRAGGSGINVLGETASGADPSAQTAISGGSFADQVSLEGVGSGSGLLDLTRESDDTSLGAELLDEIAPGGTKRGSKAGSLAGSAAGSGMGSMAGSGMGTAAGGTAAGGTAVGAPAVGRRGAAVGAVQYVEADDPSVGWFGGAALGAAVFVLFGAFALAAAVMDTSPEILQSARGLGTMMLLGIGAGVSVLLSIVFGILGKAMG